MRACHGLLTACLLLYAECHLLPVDGSREGGRLPPQAVMKGGVGSCWPPSSRQLSEPGSAPWLTAAHNDRGRAPGSVRLMLRGGGKGGKKGGMQFVGAGGETIKVRGDGRISKSDKVSVAIIAPSSRKSKTSFHGANNNLPRDKSRHGVCNHLLSKAQIPRRPASFDPRTTQSFLPRAWQGARQRGPCLAAKRRGAQRGKRQGQRRGSTAR